MSLNKSSNKGYVNKEGVLEIICDKVDKIELESQLDFKSNKSDTETSMNAVEVLHKHNKNIIMLIMEVIMHLIDAEVSYDSEMTRNEHKQKILSYSIGISKLINNFEPKIATNYDLKAEEEDLHLKSFNMTTRFGRFKRNSLVLNDMPSNQYLQNKSTSRPVQKIDLSNIKFKNRSTISIFPDGLKSSKRSKFRNTKYLMKAMDSLSIDGSINHIKDNKFKL
mmetsp:Transcript_27057/g.23903  ORF Transcript_27057/g.23903 Transcript_27057/m.23903 type:complete len:222 (+) Transcript_27057:1330-1995(+)